MEERQDAHEIRVGFCRVVLQTDPSLVSEEDYQASLRFWEQQQERERLERERLLLQVLVCCGNWPKGTTLEKVMAPLPTLRKAYAKARNVDALETAISDMEEDMINRIINSM